MQETKSEIKYAKLKKQIEEAQLVMDRIKSGYYARKEWIPKEKPTVVKLSDAM